MSTVKYYTAIAYSEKEKKWVRIHPNSLRSYEAAATIVNEWLKLWDTPVKVEETNEPPKGGRK